MSARRNEDILPIAQTDKEIPVTVLIVHSRLELPRFRVKRLKDPRF